MSFAVAIFLSSKGEQSPSLFLAHRVVEEPGGLLQEYEAIFTNVNNKEASKCNRVKGSSK